MQCICEKVDTLKGGYTGGYTLTATDFRALTRTINTLHKGYKGGYTQKPQTNMDKKTKSKNKELKYRKTRIDRHNTTVNKFLDDAKAEKKSVTKAIWELIDQKARLEAQLRRSENDKIDEVFKLCSVLFRNMLPEYRAVQLDLWIATFKRRFTLKESEADLTDKYELLKRAIEAIEEIEREQAEKHLKNAIPIKGKG